MRIRSLCLILLFCVSLLPLDPVQAQAEPARSLFDSLELMYLSDAILNGYTELEGAYRPSLLMAPVSNRLQDDPDNAALAAALQATKELRNNLETNCALLISQYRAAGKNCEADLIQTRCDQKKAELNAEIGLLHEMRGDRRRPLTRVWHSLKRSARSIWHRIGPVGRNFLRQVGPETLKIVASGGSLNTAVLKSLFKHTAQDMLRSRIADVAFQGVQRLMSGQIALLQASGIDICDPGNETEEEGAGTEGEASPGRIVEYTLTTKEINFFWNSLLEPEEDFHSCGGLWAGEDEEFDPIEFVISIDPQNQELTADLQGSRKIVNLSNGTTGEVVSRQNQSFSAKLHGPYQVEVIAEGRALRFKGNTSLTLTLDGERQCHYWEVPASGDPVLIKYWIDRIESTTIDYPYEMSVSTEDGQTGVLSLWIGGNAEPFAEDSGFWLMTRDLDLSEEDLQALWADQ